MVEHQLFVPDGDKAVLHAPVIAVVPRAQLDAVELLAHMESRITKSHGSDRLATFAVVGHAITVIHVIGQ